MSDFSNKRLIELAKSGEPHSFWSAVFPSGSESVFEAGLKTLKYGKLLTSTRSAVRIVALMEALDTQCKAISLSRKKASHLFHHCEVSLAFQQAFESIDAQSENLEIWKYALDDFLFLMIAASELLRQRSIQSMESKPSPKSSEKNLGGQMYAELFRINLDALEVIINQGRKKCPKRGSTVDAVADIQHLSAPLDRASEYVQLQTLYDIYCFSDAYARVNNGIVTVRGSKTPKQIAVDQAAARRHTSDVVHNYPRQRFIASVRDGILNSCNWDCSFSEFLSREGATAWKELGSHQRLMLEDLRELAGEFLPLEKDLKFKTGRFTVETLLRYWSFLFTLGQLARMWMNGREASGLGIALATVNEGKFDELCVASTALDPQIAPLVRKQFTATLSDKGPWDLFYTPLFVLNGEVLIALTYLEISRFDRNLLNISILAGKENNLSIKGARALDRLEKKFVDAGFCVIRDENVFDPDGNLISDVDIIAAKDNHVFALQSKVLIESDSVYERWKNNQVLAEASQQIDTCSPWLLGLIRKNYRRLGFADENPSPIMTEAILTNIWTATGAIFGGHVVVDTSYLSRILDGAVVELVEFHSEEFANRKEIARLINGERPTGAELAEFIRDSFHKRQFIDLKPFWGEQKFGGIVFKFLVSARLEVNV